ncbi:phosphodiesterase [Oscillatoria sp. CS-180]|uniref:phosphodiesterase n=1 Tax=Oscillatoria sp. CS-180 TaxID=3021720 RepID=UPI00232D0468|nr:phosphodiesterase [Oscillatoria sp. CS-180]MDB9526803.1 phosphodiesterase [Oscillatoria sp. CS-180]
MIIAQISDLHVRPEGKKAYGIVDTNSFLKAAIAQLNRLKPQPDIVIATGDLVDERTEAEYKMLQQILAPLQAPLYFAMGNHDDRTAFRNVFSNLPYMPSEGFVHYVLDEYPLRIIVLDTLVDGEGYGNIDAERLQWLAARLDENPHKPTVIFMHHPPFSTGLIGMDTLRCRGNVALADLIARYDNVKRIACGHLHRSIQTVWAGTLGSVAPSVAHQVALRLTETQPSAFVMEPPGFQLHLWHEEAGLVTHTAFVGDFDAYSYRTKAAIALYV